MAMKRTHNICLTVSEYTNNEGQEKKERVTIGAVLTDTESGHMSLNFKVAPTFKINKDGYPEAWCSVFPIDENRQAPQQAPQQFGQAPQQNVAPQQAYNQATQPVQQPQTPQPVAPQNPQSQATPQQFAQQPIAQNMGAPALDQNGNPLPF
jgi:hypothetical protein